MPRLQRRYLYTYDRAHNRLTESLALNGGSPTVKTLTYNAANQISSAGYAYDNNGNLTGDGVNSYTWDRANRLLSMGSTSYKYEGSGQRIQQTVGATVSKYLLDLKCGLPTVLAETVGANVTRFVHGPRGLHQLKTAGGVWEHILSDALAVQESRSYGIYGDLFGQTGTPQTGYGYTGEPSDSNGLVYDRARYMSPALGQFISLDPLEVFNRYAYVDGNPVMRSDPSGMVSRLMIDVNDGVAVAPRSSFTSKTPATGSQVWQPPAWYVAPVTTPPTVGSESQGVQTALNSVVNGGLDRLTQNCSSASYRDSHPDICNIQNRLFGIDRVRALTADNMEWGFSLNPRLAPQRAVSNGRLNQFVLARNMGFVFGYNIGFGDPNPITNKPTNVFPGTADEAKILALNTLNESLHIAGYLRESGVPSPLEDVKDIFGSTAGGRVTVYMGASKEFTLGDYTSQGRVPLDPSRTEIYLGSTMDTAGIGHEFGHQWDRHYGLGISGASAPNNFRTIAPGVLDQDRIQYRANCTTDDGELIPDYFMTAVFSGQNITGIPNCGRTQNVGWADTTNGDEAQNRFNQYFSEVTSGRIQP